jgi:hypothetical protein
MYIQYDLTRRASRQSDASPLPIAVPILSEQARSRGTPRSKPPLPLPRSGTYLEQLLSTTHLRHFKPLRAKFVSSADPAADPATGQTADPAADPALHEDSGDDQHGRNPRQRIDPYRTAYP